jgi:transcription elongation factor Elf1
MKFFKCPCCTKLHFTRLNGVQFENTYKTLQDYSIKKRLKCGKCHNNLAVLVHNKENQTRIIWEEYYQVYDNSYEQQLLLQSKKEEVLKREDNSEKQNQLEKILKELRDLQNQVSIQQSKIRIKAKVITPGVAEGMSDRLHQS